MHITFVGPVAVIAVALPLTGSVSGVMPYLNDMAQSCPSAANIARYAELVRDRSLGRALLATASVVSA